jgi:hypothetical protein
MRGKRKRKKVMEEEERKGKDGMQSKDDMT